MTETDGQEPLSELLMRSARAMRRRWSDSLAPWDLSPHQARALRVVRRHESARMGTIAAHLRIAPRSVTEVLDGLEERGLVRRVPDPTDRRAVLVELTDAGLSLLAEVDAARDGESATYLSVLSVRDRAHLARLLRKLDP
ncbi:MarR family winged helix-turn-helix transcriptional regulator [Pedococcus bigeumensis]|uniref:MarR family transcriptional regulator n=1 Tax=Pedococcus bigeumensis TaxID=433644 RepID=A0A502D2Q3_9MICO|nr:MarR family transcriptional regulator [Pedococcus bigeumensis]TPG19468.1 MarR family transcriptional regulator [Pedococcus bigeumensis]